MEYISAISCKQINFQFKLDKYSTKLFEAQELFDSGNAELAHDICESLFDKTSNAIFLSGSYSNEGEDSSAFSDRHLSMMFLAWERGNVMAAYTLAVYYETGEMLDEDYEVALGLYKASSEGRFPPACSIYGIMLFSGAEGVERNIDLGLSLVKFASVNNVDEASEFLLYLKQK